MNKPTEIRTSELGDLELPDQVWDQLQTASEELLEQFFGELPNDFAIEIKLTDIEWEGEK